MKFVSNFQRSLFQCFKSSHPLFVTIFSNSNSSYGSLKIKFLKVDCTFWYFKKVLSTICIMLAHNYLNEQLVIYEFFSEGMIYHYWSYQTSHGGWLSWWIGILEMFSGILTLAWLSPFFCNVCLIICLKTVIRFHLSIVC